METQKEKLANNGSTGEEDPAGMLIPYDASRYVNPDVVTDEGPTKREEPQEVMVEP